MQHLGHLGSLEELLAWLWLAGWQLAGWLLAGWLLAGWAGTPGSESIRPFEGNILVPGWLQQPI